jgi:hypothetical protein
MSHRHCVQQSIALAFEQLSPSLKSWDSFEETHLPKESLA